MRRVGVGNEVIKSERVLAKLVVLLSLVAPFGDASADIRFVARCGGSEGDGRERETIDLFVIPRLTSTRRRAFPVAPIYAIHK